MDSLLQALLHSLGRALHVRLHNDAKLFALALGNLAEQIVQRDLLIAGKLLFLGLGCALVGQLAGQLLVLHRVKDVARGRHLGEAGDLHRGGGARLFQRAALVVAHGAHAAHSRARNDNVALMQCAFLHQNGGHRAHALVQPGLNHRALGAAVGVGLQLFHLGHQVDVLQQVLNALARQRGHRHADGVAAPFLRHQLILGQLLHHMRRGWPWVYPFY